MDLGISGKNALVCGASSGLGFACALRLSQEGANVAIVSRTPERIQDAARRIEDQTSLPVVPIAGDLSTQQDVQRVVDQAQTSLGNIDILLHNTGGPPAGTLLDLQDEQWLKAAELLVLSYVRLTRLLSPEMAERGWGRVLSITSYVAREPSDELILSSAFRPGILACSKSYSRLYGRQNVLFNALLPGAFATDRQTELIQKRASASGRSIEEETEAAQNAIPTGRMGEPSNLADLAAFLLSDRNQDITGAAIPIEGGALKGLF